jgi:tetratricopeptide (TPR) repeat protein
MNLLFIADINAYAVSLFERGSHAYAKTKFAEALEKVHSFSMLCEHDYVDTDDVVLEGGKLRCFNDSPLNSPYSSNVYSVTPASQKKDLYKEQEIYGAAFLLSSDIPIIAEAVSAVLLFNLGLYYHKKALHTEKLVTYRKAMDLYRQSLALLDRKTESSALLVLEAALYYNQAHIHQVIFGDTNKSISFMAKLEGVVECMAKSENVMLSDLNFFEDGLELFADAIGPET